MNRTLLRTSYGDWASNLQKTGVTLYSVTLASNAGLGNKMEFEVPMFKRLLNKFDCYCNRRLLGINFHRKPDQLKLGMFGFIEHAFSNIHMHGFLMTMNKTLSYWQILDAAKYAWQGKTVVSGSVDLKQSYNEADWLSYITKEPDVRSYSESNTEADRLYVSRHIKLDSYK